MSCSYDTAVEVCKELIEVASVGGGKFICPPAFEPVIRKAIEARRQKSTEKVFNGEVSYDEHGHLVRFERIITRDSVCGYKAIIQVLGA